MIEPRHRLSEYVSTLAGFVVSSPAEDPVITQVTYDSREVHPGALFICKGVHFSPMYLSQAIEKGAVAYLSEREYPEAEGLSCVLVSDMRKAITEVGTLFHNGEWKGLTIIGVTGTKGKSTVTMFLHSILSTWARGTNGPRPGLLSTIAHYDGVVDAPSVRTTPETLELYGHLHNAVASGLTHMCMEVSSQALRYQRVGNIDFEVGCWVNISEDHISPQEHRDYEDYLTAKLSLFSRSRLAVVNARTQDSPRVLEAASRCEKTIRYAIIGDGYDPVEAELVGFDVVPSALGLEFSVRMMEGETHRLSIGMPGSFNVENALAAIGIAMLLGVDMTYVREGLASARIPGRMEVFRLDRGTTVIVDYAHQKLSVETLLACVRHDYPGAPITVVFGTPGDKAWNRREEFGTLAGMNADEIFLTEEDPGDQSVEEICQEVDRHVRATGHKPAHIVPNRPDAITQAIDTAPDDGLVLILGKGDERWQLRHASAVPVPSDIDCVRAYLEGA